MELEMQLAQKNVECKFTDNARNWLGKNGYDEKMGARPMARLIQEKLKKPLAEELLFGQLINGGQVLVDEVDNKIVFKISTHQTQQQKQSA